MRLARLRVSQEMSRERKLPNAGAPALESCFGMRVERCRGLRGEMRTGKSSPHQGRNLRV